MKISAAGDAIIQRRIPENYGGYEEIAKFISESDASFFNLETTLNYEGECYASQYSGGTYVRVVPEVIPELMRYGFNMTSFNNNHAMDFSYEGLLSTLDVLDSSGLVHAGVGRNLAEASCPRYLETKEGRVALIAVNTSFNPAMMAGNQTDIVPGRPGINGMRVNKHVCVTDEEFEFIKSLGERTGINVERTIIAKEGYYALPEDNEANLGELKFVRSEKSEYVMKIDPRDIERVKRAIHEAKLQADYIIVSVHSHQLAGDKKENPADFLVDFCHECIDIGANAIIGHGPHLLRPIEIYKNAPIFYSLGDFILELYSVSYAPADFFEKHGLDPRVGVHELLKARSKNFTVGLMEDERMMMSVIPLWEVDKNGSLLSLKLMPIELAMRDNKSQCGLPRRAPAEKIAKYLSDMSAAYGTKFRIDEDANIVCSW